MMPDEATVRILLDARARGVRLRRAAALAGIHVATVCRWQARDPELRKALAEAAAKGRIPRGPRPTVRWRKDCPACRAKAVVRTTAVGSRYWRCGRWPLCPWMSWRPRHPRDCRRCGVYRVWSHSRRSVVCAGCGLRTQAPLL